MHCGGGVVYDVEAGLFYDFAHVFDGLLHYIVYDVYDVDSVVLRATPSCWWQFYLTIIMS